MAGTRTHGQQQKLLLEIIKRSAGYVNATNSNIAVVLSYSMADIGGLVPSPQPSESALRAHVLNRRTVALHTSKKYYML
ncbi:Uncharacterised protein [Burkholderia pseudomallei]|nr:hypothetical protein BOC51_05235 [Burkholderia pseudomallei]EIF70908.1 hypothetical protein BP354E_4942 [Burkholderia pseudomallei 354e]EIF73286.1 hypothetical protein BP354A_5772 [Burkholderia pseudomallei 354a]OND90580.1 hypothetical protein AQ941_27665 [Burkholderia pseudomallei]ONE00903.1 hypothetical protein AQ942_02035 [Burkholderia pseudomallei]